MADPIVIPTRQEIVKRLADKFYGQGIINNAHRGDVVEMMVLAALGNDWNHVGLGWHPWDLQRGHDQGRVRIQVKQTAAVQLWGDTVQRVLNFGWKPKLPSYFRRDNPGEHIEDEGWFCDLFVFGIHDETDRARIDQADPEQWLFMVIPTTHLKPRTSTMRLSKARMRWTPVEWQQLRQEVERRIQHESR
tara:strand:+ start:299 stop:868 length:570 start_codon:yes stop_codon:yes gene_type:complete